MNETSCSNGNTKFDTWQLVVDKSNSCRGKQRVYKARQIYHKHSVSVWSYTRPVLRVDLEPKQSVNHLIGEKIQK